MWLPKWLGETYAFLHERFGLEIFTFREAKEALEADDAWLRVALSRLHGSRCVLIIEKTRPKQYGLIQAENFIFLASNGLKEIKRIGQERYLNLICSAARALKQSLRMESLALYGSVARGRAKDESDVDLLVVSDQFKGTLGSRIDSLASVEEAVSRELAWLEKRGVYSGLSFCPLRKEEVLKFPPLLLDLTEDAIILHDEDDFLSKALSALRRQLQGSGARRIFLGEEDWYWDLRPGDELEEATAL